MDMQAPAVEAAKTVTVPRDQLPECQPGDVYTAKVVSADDSGVTLELATTAAPSLSETAQYDQGYADDSGDRAIMGG